MKAKNLINLQQMKKKVKYSCDVSSYNKIGSVYSKTLEANSVVELQDKKDAFILVEGDLAEVITFSKIVVTTVEIQEDTEEVKYLVDETTNEYLMSLARPPKSYDKKKKYAKCHDKFNLEIKNGSFVDVQQDGIQKVYAKNGQLYFKPYGEEDRVSAYFSNDLILVDENGDPIIENM